MRRRNDIKTRLILLAFVLVFGSAQARTSYFCSMMDMVIHDVCCCEGLDADPMASGENEPCCDQMVSIVVESADDQVQPKTKSIKFESNVDPPNAVMSAFEYTLESLYASPLSIANHGGIALAAGNNTYLITQRLRI